MSSPREAASARERSRRARGRFALERRFGVDTRALAAFRVAVGLLLVADLLLRSRHLVAFYTDRGVLPRSTLVELYPGAQLSLHAASGAPWFQGFLFVVAAGFALALVVGYRTRLATVASLLLLASLHARNPLVLNGGDVLLRRLLFWGLFLPLGGRWSVDALGGDGRRSVDAAAPSPRVATVASAALLLQLVLVYTVTGLFKLRGDRWLAGTELQHLFYVDQLTVFLGDVLVGYPGLLRGLTWLWLALVLSSGLLVVLTGRARVRLVSLFVAMHVGMLATMRLGIFPLVSIAALVPFLPGPVWDAVERVLAGRLDAWRRLGPRLSIGRFVDRPRRIAARRRFAFGRALGRISPASLVDVRPGDPSADRRLAAVVVGGLLVGSLAWNAMGLGYVATPDRLASVRDPAEHQWDMFARGGRDDGWFVVPGELESGRRIDAYYRSPVDRDRPPDLTRTYPSARWLRYSLALRGNDALPPRFAGYLCWRWNRGHPDDLVRVTVYYNEIPVGLDGPGPTHRVELGAHSC